jgi:hypothetical protein
VTQPQAHSLLLLLTISRCAVWNGAVLSTLFTSAHGSCVGGSASGGLYTADYIL